MKNNFPFDPVYFKNDDKNCNAYRNDKLVKSTPRPIHTITGEILEFFKAYKARTLKKIHDLPKGTELEVETMPSGQIYLMYHGEIYKTGVKPGVEFEFI